MDTSLQRKHLTADSPNAAQESASETEVVEQHIHLPGASAWPFVLSAAILLAVTGILFIPDAPWLTIVALPLVLVGILGWALENPESHTSEVIAYRKKAISLPAKEILERANTAVERTVTFSSTMFSAHPIKLEIDSETPQGAVIALNGTVELAEQRERLEEEIRQIPGVLDVRDFVVAEDSILNFAYARIEKLREAGKLEGATNLSVLVENYILNLYGNVPTKSMKYALERELIDIPGVRVIVNHIGLNPDVPGYLGKTRNA